MEGGREEEKDTAQIELSLALRPISSLHEPPARVKRIRHDFNVSCDSVHALAKSAIVMVRPSGLPSSAVCSN